MATLDPAFTDIGAALEAIGDLTARPRGTVRISAGEHAAVSALGSGLSRFMIDHPGIAVEIASEAAPVDIVAEGYDAGVRMGDTLAQDVIAMRIGPDVRVAIVAAPAYLATHPAVPAERLRRS